MKKKIVLTFLVIISFRLACEAQVQKFDESEGIEFVKGLNWLQILTKAKAENRYIFVDCYATWCAPCKMMDKDVYSRPSVAEIFNVGFINVKVQIDRTKTDDVQTQSWYPTAIWLKSTYHIDALPSFLFFDPNGKLVLQRSGVMEPATFIQLGREARNLDLLSVSAQNFMPGKLDTAQENGLINAYATSNKDLAGRIAADYLSRIPKDQLSKKGNGQLMVRFSDNPEVLDIAIDYIKGCLSHPLTEESLEFIYALKKQSQVEGVITAHFAKLSQQQFADTANLYFAGQFLFYPGVKQTAINYIRQLNYHEIGQNVNLSFISLLNNEPEAQSIAGKYIVQLTPRKIYTKPMLNFIAAFTQSTGVIGMNIFYHHAQKVDAVIGNNYFGRDQVIFGLLKKEFDPIFAVAKTSGQEPSWQALSNTIAKKYDPGYAEMTMNYARLLWYQYLYMDKKQIQYLPQYLDAAITKMQRLRNDTVASKLGDNYILNNIAYGAFGHIDGLKQLQVVTNWMREVTGRNPDDIGDLDTYACLLYRIGKADSALIIEQKTRQMAIVHNDKFMISHATTTIDKMKKGELFWKEKEYQQ